MLGCWAQRLARGQTRQARGHNEPSRSPLSRKKQTTIQKKGWQKHGVKHSLLPAPRHMRVDAAQQRAAHVLPGGCHPRGISRGIEQRRGAGDKRSRHAGARSVGIAGGGVGPGGKNGLAGGGQVHRLPAMGGGGGGAGWGERRRASGPGEAIATTSAAGAVAMHPPGLLPVLLEPGTPAPTSSTSPPSLSSPSPAPPALHPPAVVAEG